MTKRKCHAEFVSVSISGSILRHIKRRPTFLLESDFIVSFESQQIGIINTLKKHSKNRNNAQISQSYYYTSQNNA